MMIQGSCDMIHGSTSCDKQKYTLYDRLKIGHIKITFGTGGNQKVRGHIYLKYVALRMYFQLHGGFPGILDN